jgi:predicted dithiol-disulfide oxidoreductase (DUF899 family)
MWIDGLHGVSHHLAQRVDFAVIAKAPLPKLRAWARHRGWAGLRLLSSHDSTFNLDLGAEDPDGGQWPRVSVFVKRDGLVPHSYTTAMIDYQRARQSSCAWSRQPRYQFQWLEPRITPVDAWPTPDTQVLLSAPDSGAVPSRSGSSR